jgi:hypothetical protein
MKLAIFTLYFLVLFTLTLFVVHAHVPVVLDAEQDARLNALEAASTCAQQPQERHYQYGDTVVLHSPTFTFDGADFYVFKR